MRSSESRRPAGLAGVHAENDEIVRAGIEAERSAGNGGDPLAHARSRPAVAEHEAVARCLEFARSDRRAPARLPSLDAARCPARAARRARRGVDVSAESCPHYLLLDESELTRRGGEAKINPPLRARPLACAGSTSSPPTTSAGRPSASAATTSSRSPRARPALELIVPLIHDALRAARGRPPARRAPGAALRPLAAQGQHRCPGADADLLVLDPNRAWEVDPATLVTPAGWSPYAGRRLRGRVIAAFSRGVQIWDGERVCAPAGHGRFVPARLRASRRSPAAAPR